ncbi:MAG TPA: HD domain-containing phosphohydrolase [Vicinamibacterales bacterium]|jgi:putative nucleotidyltransferase with HDIG domain
MDETKLMTRPLKAVTRQGDEAPTIDPVALLKAFVTLRRLTGMYPPGHPAIEQKLTELDETLKRHLREGSPLRLDVIHGQPHVDGVLFRAENESNLQVLRDLSELGVDSIHIAPGVARQELLGLSELLWQMRDAPSGEPIQERLARQNIHHVTLGRLIPLDTRWRAAQWPDAPTGTLDPAYEETLFLMERAFDDAASGKGVNLRTVREVVQLLVQKIAGSSAALGQILAVKLYENLTYCHSVNVAALSLLIGKQLGFDDVLTSALAEAALLHDIGKTRIPLDVLRKPGALDRRERTMMESHTIFGAEILTEVDGLGPLAPTVALEHHRGVDGSGYPDLGAGIVPHTLSQIVSVADIYEAITGARSYQDPSMPEQACLVLARLAGTKLNTSIVKAFVSAISFFPIGSFVQTDRDEMGVVIRTNDGEPLHPVIALIDGSNERVAGEVDTSARDSSGAYARHLVATLRPPEGLDITGLLL